MGKVKMLQELNEAQMKKFVLENEGVLLSDKVITELKEELLFGDFIISGGYKFKKIYSSYICMETPTEKYKIHRVSFIKAPNDHYPGKR